MKTAKQATSSKRDNPEWLKPWQFKPGQSGNMSGRPKGAISMKTRAANYLATLDDKEALEFLTGMDKRDVWEMGEGKPKQDTDVTSGGEKIVFTVVTYGDKDSV